jgi:hypothetical protein
MLAEGGAMMIFHLRLVLDVTATPADADLLDAAEVFMEELHALADQGGHRDCTVGVEADTPDTGRLDVDLDVEATSVDEAFPIALAWLRTALHAAHVPTPGWDVGSVKITPVRRPSFAWA